MLNQNFNFIIISLLYFKIDYLTYSFFIIIPFYLINFKPYHLRKANHLKLNLKALLMPNLKETFTKNCPIINFNSFNFLYVHSYFSFKFLEFSQIIPLISI
jgi:hypothetical protein